MKAQRFSPSPVVDEGDSWWAEALSTAVFALEAAGVRVEVPAHSAFGAVLVAEAVNAEAKLNEEFYRLKPPTWAAAAQVPGVESGWGEDGCFYLFSWGAGTACAHDPYGELWRLVPAGVWEHPWHGIYRQGFALDWVQGKRHDLLKVVAAMTAPTEKANRLRERWLAMSRTVFPGVYMRLCARCGSIRHSVVCPECGWKKRDPVFYIQDLISIELES